MYSKVEQNDIHQVARNSQGIAPADDPAIAGEISWIVALSEHLHREAVDQQWRKRVKVEREGNCRATRILKLINEEDFHGAMILFLNSQARGFDWMPSQVQLSQRKMD